MKPVQLVYVCGILTGMFALTLIPVLGVSVVLGDGLLWPWSAATLGAALVAGALLWRARTSRLGRLRARDGFAIVTLFWTLLSCLSAIPLWTLLDIPFADALFEAVSGFTTTGATVLAGLDTLPDSVRYFRQQLQWFGGLGVIVSAVAVLPMLGVGGMQLVKAETSGPMKEEKLTPRIANTARALWRVYLALTVVCVAAYLLAGMNLFDAIGHAMATVSTGGFSTHDASMAFFDSPLIEAICITFMLLGAIPFTVHYLALQQRSLRPYRGTSEVALFVAIVASAILVISLVLAALDPARTFVSAMRAAAFTVASVITSSGFGLEDFAQWPSFLPVFVIFLSCIGGCAASTAGGVKVIRLQILAANGVREINKLIHPTMIRPVKLNGRVVSLRVVDAVWGFFVLYALTYSVLMLLAMLGGLDQVSAFGAVAATLNNLGPGLGEVSQSFQSVSAPLKLLFSFAMLLGRLELFTLLVLFHPEFWRD